MPFDLVAWWEEAAFASLGKVNFTTDRVYHQADSHDIYVKKRAPWLAGLLYMSETATRRYAELRQPSLKVPHRFIRSTDIGGHNARAGFINLFATPLPLYAEEKLQAFVLNATNEGQMIIAWLASGKCTRAMQEAVSPTHTLTGVADGTVTIGTAWGEVTITWDQDLPKGRYAVVGMKVGSYKSATPRMGAARLVLLENTWRIGCAIEGLQGDKLGMESLGTQDFDGGSRFPLMPEISFPHDQKPTTLEVIEGAANSDRVIELLLQKIS